eukprot:TRINITY_DN14211_c0_g1_i1.p1 TRINITY_DN14211_c0_g1~~TRINITY_DN14211_c0_g1_i1.p1  ORF type:complete len:342 (+),score=56.31 TRINITY_DN14211_c0_g1_i1:3-1028(+)
MLSNQQNSMKLYAKSFFRVLKRKFDPILEPMPWVSQSAAHDAATSDRALQYQEESFFASLVQSADQVEGLESLGRKSWKRLKKLYFKRAQTLSILTEVPSALYERFFSERIEWLSQFNLNECVPDRCVDGSFRRGGLWRHVSADTLEKLLLLPQFDPNVDAASGEVLLKIFDAHRGSFPPAAHLALQNCFPRLKPAQASSLWFAREQIFLEDQATAGVVFDYILQHWQVFNPRIRLFNSIESFAKFQEYVSETKKKSVPREIAAQSASGMWRNLLSSAKKEEEFREQATVLLRELPVVPDFVKAIRAGKPAGSVIPRIGDENATRILNEISSQTSGSCEIS